MAKKKELPTHMLLFVCETTQCEYEAITLGTFKTNDEAVIYARANYKTQIGALVVRIVAKNHPFPEWIKITEEK